MIWEIVRDIVEIVFNSLLVIIPIVAMVLIFRITRNVVDILSYSVARWRNKRMFNRIQKSAIVMSDDFITDVFLWFFNAIRFGIIFGGLLIYSVLILGSFPRTNWIAELLLNLIDFSGVGQFLFEHASNLLQIILILVITYFILKFLRLLFSEVAQGKVVLAGFPAEWAEPTLGLVRILVIGLSLILIYNFLPAKDNVAVQGFLIFGGLVSGLGSTVVTSNIVAGIVLTYTGAFKTGDAVVIDTHSGYIIDSSMLVTRIRTSKNVIVSIPNSKVLSSSIINYSRLAKEKGLILHTDVMIRHEIPWRQVHQLLEQAALKTAGIIEIPAPFVLQKQLERDRVIYQLNAYTNNETGHSNIYSDLHSNIQDQFAQFNIALTVPHIELHQTDQTPYTTPLGKEPNS